MTIPAGWNQLYNQVGNSYRRLAMYRIADGTEGATQTVLTSSGERSAHNSYRISGGTFTGLPVAGVVATGSSNSPNPPSLTSGFGSVPTLWIAAEHNAGDDNNPAPTAPANYGNLITAYTGDGSSEARVSTARRELTAASENPGSFTIGSSETWGANTVAIQGGASIDLSISKSASTGPYFYNDPIIFTLTATNLSTTDNATGVTVNDLLPAGYTYVSHTASNGNANYIPGTGVWTIGNLTSNSSATLSITATIDCYESAYNNTATISGNQYGPVSGNNTSTVNITPQTGGTTPWPVYANNDATGTPTGIPVNINVLANDLWSVDPYSLSIVSGPSHGICQIQTGWIITYTSSGGYTGTDQFTYELCDNSSPQQCDQATVTITVTPDYFDVCGQARQPRTYYLPFPENATQIRKTFVSGATTASGYDMTNNARTIVSMKVPYPSVVIVYDH